VNPKELETYLYEHIPITEAMGVEVLRSDRTQVLLKAPLAPNLNHQKTAFGGSIGTLATLACWSYVRVRLNEAGQDGTLVIQRNIVDFERPVISDFTAETLPVDPEQEARFLQTFAERGKSRILMRAQVLSEGGVCAVFEGQFVALRA
jgi:thioesterase domain-containing protein